jgi:hypothetical protein
LAECPTEEGANLIAKALNALPALPEIVAVVEAAEPIAEGPWPEGHAQNLRAALAALQQKFTEATP